MKEIDPEILETAEAIFKELQKEGLDDPPKYEQAVADNFIGGKKYKRSKIKEAIKLLRQEEIADKVQHKGLLCFQLLSNFNEASGKGSLQEWLKYKSEEAVQDLKDKDTKRELNEEALNLYRETRNNIRFTKKVSIITLIIIGVQAIFVVLGAFRSCSNDRKTQCKIEQLKQSIQQHQQIESKAKGKYQGLNHLESTRRTEISDIAPTLSSLLHITFPNGATGNPISEVID